MTAVTNAQLQVQIQALANKLEDGLRAVTSLAPVVPGVSGLVAEGASFWARYRKGIAGFVAAVAGLLAFLLSQPWVIANDRLAAALGIASAVVSVISGLLVKYLPNAPEPGTVVIDQTGNVLAANAVSFPGQPAVGLAADGTIP